LITENIETDTSVAVDIWMINACREVYLRRISIYDMDRGVARRRVWRGMGLLYLWWFEGVVCGKMNREKEDTTGIWTIALEIQSVYIS
jgi:hypothetical protein